MPWSGGVYTRTNGTYNGSTVWASDAAASIKIQSSRHDTHDQDLANGINACVAKDGSNTVTALNLTATVDANTGVITIGGVNFANMLGTQNCFVGNAANFTLTGYFNVGLGYTALQNITSGIGNTALGNDSLINNTTGSYNVAVGFDSLPNTTTGGKNIGIGISVDVPSATANDQLSIQNAIYGINNNGTFSTVSSGNIGFYVKAPTARIHLPAGTATAGTAPLKLTAGTNLTTPENGALEFDGTHLYITIGGVRTTIV
jgi:hypothetical protein